MTSQGRRSRRRRLSLLTRLPTSPIRGLAPRPGPSAFLPLPSGIYRVEVQADGFKTWVQTGLQLEPNQVRTINPALELGEQKTTVEVTATTSSVETGKSQAANTIETRTVTEAPLLEGTCIQAWPRWRLS